MKQDITKLCADSLRSFTQSNYGITLKSSHAHELVAAYFGYSSRAAMLADAKCPISNLTEAEIIVLNPPTLFVDERLKGLENLPLNLPSSGILAEGVYAPLVADERFAGRIWPNIRDLAMALVEERVQEFRMFGQNIGEMDWITGVDIKTTEFDVFMTVPFDYPTNTEKRYRQSEIEIKLPRVAGNIGYGKPQVMPVFYSGQMRDPDFRRKHNIEWPSVFKTN